MSTTGPNTAPGQFFRRREILLPTWRGCLLLLFVFGTLLALSLRYTYTFFALTQRVPAKVLVMEGWVPDYAMRVAADEIREGRAEMIYVTGGPLDYGAPLSEFGTYAHVGAAVLTRMGVPTNQVLAVPAERVQQDRTYSSAVYLARYFETERIPVSTFNLISMGAHSRRSRLLFRKAFGEDVQIGIISVPYVDFEPLRWYASSAGVRGVINEVLAYGYARLLFWPDCPDSSLPAPLPQSSPPAPATGSARPALAR